MKTFGKALIAGALFVSAFAVADGARAAPTRVIVSWERINGIVEPGNVVGGITGAGQPWSTAGGNAVVDLTDSIVAFNVNGLVFAGGSSIGTTGTVASVQGTLVCNPSAGKPIVINTPAVSLNATGDASFFGSVSAMTTSCKVSRGIAFLITTMATGTPWIAYGAVFSSP